MGQQLTDSSFQCTFSVHNEPVKTRFEIEVTEAIDEVLPAFGDNSMQNIYCLLEVRYGIEKDEIPFKIEGFAKAIEDIFGSAAKLIEVKILESLHVRCLDFSFAPNH